MSWQKVVPLTDDLHADVCAQLAEYFSGDADSRALNTEDGLLVLQEGRYFTIDIRVTEVTLVPVSKEG
jgi:hypothetical protein